MMPALQAQAKGLEGITFHGWKAHHEVQDILAQCHLMPFPSIREFGGGVVLEAMALGVVPLVVDYAGPGELVTADVGLKVPCGTRAEITRDFATALHRLADDPHSLPAMAQAARERVQSHFLWSCKARQVAQVYDWVLAGRPDPKPDAFGPRA